MKERTLLFASILLFVLSCKKDDNSIHLSVNGKISVNIGLEIFSGDLDTGWKSTMDTDDFKVVICKSTGEAVQTYERAADMPDEISLEPDEYYVEAHSNNYMPAAFENPYYYGSSDNFVLDKEEHRTVTVNCELANCAVTVVYSENVQADFIDFYTVVSTSDSSLIYNNDEIRYGYFGLKPISIEASLTYSLNNGLEQIKVLTGNIDYPQPKKHYEVHVDSSVEDGTASVNIHLDDSIVHEIINLFTEDTSEIPGRIGYGDLLITEIMYNPTAIPDAEGEWFEIYNNTLSDININELVIKRSSDLHIVDQEIIIKPGEHYVLARSESATSAPMYIYGTDITLTNSGAELIIANYGTNGSNGSLIASVNYGLSGFPNPAGASINLDYLYYDVESAKIGTSWCESTEIFETGDLGTPGSVNSSCE